MPTKTMTNTPTELQNNDRLVLAEHFRGKDFNDKLVKEFCTNNKIAMTDAGNVEDFIYQLEYDERMKKVTPIILAELSKYQVSGEYDTEQKQKDILNVNDGIAERIAIILEENDVLFREIEMLKSMAGDIAQLLNNADGLASRMCANVMAEMAQEKLGNPLTVKALSEEHTQIANRKHLENEAKEPAEELSTK